MSGRLILAGGAVVGAAVLLASPVIGDGVNRSSEPAQPTVVATVPATTAQTAGAGLPSLANISANAKTTKKAKKVVAKPVVLRSRITTAVISTEEGKGSYVGIRCPSGSRAISGGALNNYINLMVSSSSPNHPVTGKYTPNTWWVSVTNNNVDGNGGTLTWRGVVNCLSPVKLGK